MTMTTASTPATPIATFEDILQVMEQNPRLQQAMRYHVLDEQYRELPAVVAQLATTVQDLAAVVQMTVERLDRLEAIVANSVERLDRLEAAVAQLAIIVANSVERLDRLETIVANSVERLDRLETAVAELTTAVAGIAERQAQLEAAMALLTATVTGIAERQEILDRRVNSMHGDVGRLTGRDYEGIINSGIAIRMRTHINLRHPIVVHDTSNTATTAALNSILNQPLDDDIITPDEALEIIRADFVAGTREGRTTYALGETSITLRRDDITRAGERAALLAKATGATTHAFAIGAEEPALEHRILAERTGVTIITAPESDRRSATSW